MKYKQRNKTEKPRLYNTHVDIRFSLGSLKRVLRKPC